MRKKSEEDFFVREPIDEKGILQAEEKLGVKLPETYKKLILLQNGGFINFNAHPSPVPTYWADDHVKVDAFKSISEDGGILNSDYLIQVWGMPEGLVLLNGDGHMWIALDYRQAKENPPVIYLDCEADQIVTLAPDFDTFLNRLYVAELPKNMETQSLKVYTKEEIQNALRSTDDLGQMIDLIHYLNYRFEPDFIVEQVLQLSTHENADIRYFASDQALRTLDEFRHQIEDWGKVKELTTILLDDLDERVQTNGKFMKSLVEQ